MSRYLRSSYQTLTAYVPGEQPRDLAYIKLNTNESPYPPAPQVVAAVNAGQIELLRLYSDPTCMGLKQKLAAQTGLLPENIFISNGSDDALNFVFMAYSELGATFADITYGFYPIYANLHAAPTRVIPLEDDFSLDPGQYQGCKGLIVIANPNAPTGLSISVDAIEGILRDNPDAVVAIDEAYVDFGGDSALPLLKKYDNLLVIRTFSKSRCFAGGRLGYIVGNAPLIADLEKLRCSTNPFNIDRLALVMGEATVDADSYYVEKCQEICRTRDKTAAALRQLGLRVLPSKTNFLFVHAGAVGGERMYLELKKRAILVRHFPSARTKDYIRVTIGTPAQMEIFVAAVEEILQQ